MVEALKDQVKIVGIGGLPRSGKDTVAKEFMDAGFFGVSFGDIVREKSRVRHGDEPDPISVGNMTETSNWLRQLIGPDFALQIALDQFKEASTKTSYKGLVVWSIRAPVEVDFILKHGGTLIWLESSDEVRYDRYIAHLRDGEVKISIEELKRQEALQWTPQPGIQKEVQMDISYVNNKATRVLVNNTDDEAGFSSKVKQLISTI